MLIMSGTENLRETSRLPFFPLSFDACVSFYSDSFFFPYRQTLPRGIISDSINHISSRSLVNLLAIAAEKLTFSPFLFFQTLWATTVELRSWLQLVLSIRRGNTPILMRLGVNVVFKKVQFDLYFFFFGSCRCWNYSQCYGCGTYYNISEIIEDFVFV